MTLLHLVLSVGISPVCQNGWIEHSQFVKLRRCKHLNKQKTKNVAQQLSLNMVPCLALTRWWLKKVFSKMHASPMCFKIWKILLADPPATRVATRVAKHSKKFPAGILVPGITGWLFHTNSLRHLGLEQTELTSAIVPRRRVSTKGSGAWQKWQNLKRMSSCEKNVMNLSSVRMLSSSLIYTLLQH